MWANSNLLKKWAIPILFSGNSLPVPDNLHDVWQTCSYISNENGNYMYLQAVCGVANWGYVRIWVSELPTGNNKFIFGNVDDGTYSGYYRFIVKNDKLYNAYYSIDNANYVDDIANLQNINDLEFSKHGLSTWVYSYMNYDDDNGYVGSDTATVYNDFLFVKIFDEDTNYNLHNLIYKDITGYHEYTPCICTSDHQFGGTNYYTNDVALVDFDNYLIMMGVLDNKPFIAHD